MVYLLLRFYPSAHKKLECRCTTRNLSVCNGTIIVLKITCTVNRVSVFTNFVIRKRDKLRNSSVDKIGEHCRLKQAIDVKLYYPYTQFPCNVRLSHRRIATYSVRPDFLDYYSYLLTGQFLVDNYLWQFYGVTSQLRGRKNFITRPRVR